MYIFNRSQEWNLYKRLNEHFKANIIWIWLQWSLILIHSIVAYPLCFFVTFANQRLGFNGNGKGGVGRGLFALRLSQFETKSAAIFLSSLRVVDQSEDYCQKKKQ